MFQCVWDGYVALLGWAGGDRGRGGKKGKVGGGRGKLLGGEGKVIGGIFHRKYFC